MELNCAYACDCHTVDVLSILYGYNPAARTKKATCSTSSFSLGNDIYFENDLSKKTPNLVQFF